MVEPVSMTVGAAAAALVSRAIEKGIEKSADSAVDAVPGAVGKVVAWVRHRFAGRDQLAKVEEAPDSPSRQAALGQIIDAEIVDDERTELARLLEDAKRAAPSAFFHIGSMSATEGSNAIGQNNAPITMTYNAGSGSSSSGGAEHPR